MRILIRLVATAAALFVAVQLVPGITMDPALTTSQMTINLGAVALIFGVVNAVIRPLLKATTCLINVLTLGLFTLVINGLMLWLTSAIGQSFNLGFEVNGFLAALEGALVVSIMSLIFGILIPDKDD